MARKKKEKTSKDSSDEDGEVEWEMEGPDNDKKSSSRLAGKKPPKWRKVLMLSDNSEDDEEDPEICPICESKNDPVHSDRKNRMIGCDGCDKWYHWSCVGIDQNNKPDKNADWFCRRCSRKKTEASEWKPTKGEEQKLEILPLREPTRASGASSSSIKSGNSSAPFRTLAQKKEYDTPLEARAAKAPIQGLVAKPPVLKRDQGSKANKRRGRPPARLRDDEPLSSGPAETSRTSSIDQSRTSTPDSASNHQWSDNASTPPPGKKKKKESWSFNKKQSDLQAKLPPGLTVERHSSDDQGESMASDSAGLIPRSQTPDSLLDSDGEKDTDRQMLQQRYYGRVGTSPAPHLDRARSSPAPDATPLAIKEERRDSSEDGDYILNKPPDAIAKLPLNITIQKEGSSPYQTPERTPSLPELPPGITIQKERKVAPVRLPPGVTLHKEGKDFKLTAKLPPGITVETGGRDSPHRTQQIEGSPGPEPSPSRLGILSLSTQDNREDAETDKQAEYDGVRSGNNSPVDTSSPPTPPPVVDASSRPSPVPPTSSFPPEPSETTAPSPPPQDNLESVEDLAIEDQSDNTDEENPAEPVSPRKSSRQGNTESLARIRAALRADSNSDEELFGSKVPVKPRKKKLEETEEVENVIAEKKINLENENLTHEGAPDTPKNKDGKEKRGRKEKGKREDKKEIEMKEEKEDKRVKDKRKEKEEKTPKKGKNKKKEIEPKEDIAEKDEAEQEPEKMESRSSGRTKRNTRRTSSAENLANTTDSSKEDSMADDFASKIPYRKPVRGRKRKADETDDPEDSAQTSEPTTPKKSGRGNKSPSKALQSPSKAMDKPERQSSRNRRKSGRVEPEPPSPPPAPVPAPPSVQGKPTAVVGPVRPEGVDEDEDSSKSKKRGRPSKKDKAKEKDDDLNEMQALQRIANGLRKRKTDKIDDDSILFGGDSKLTALQNELVVAPATINKTNDKELLKVDDKIRPRLTVKPTGLEQLERDWEEEKKDENTGEKMEEKSNSSQWIEVKEATGPSSGKSLILKTSKSLIIKPFPKVAESDTAKTPPTLDQTEAVINPEESVTDSKNDNVETADANENVENNTRTDNANVRNAQDTKQIEGGNKKKESNEHIYLTEEEIAKLPIDICAKKPGSHYSNQSNLAPSMSEVDLEPPGLPADLADVMPSLDAALAMCRDKEQKKTEAEEIQKIRDSLLLGKETTQTPPPPQFRQDYAFPQMPPQDIYKPNMGWQVGGPTSDHQYMKQTVVSTVDQLKPPIQAHPLFPNATFTSDSISQTPANVQTQAQAVHTLPPTVGMPRTIPNQYPAPSSHAVGVPRTYPPASTQGGSMPPLIPNNNHPISSRPDSIDSGVGGSPETNTNPQSSAQNSSEESDVWGLFEKEIADFAERCEEPPAERSEDPSIKKEMQDTRPVFKILNTSELNEKAKELHGQTNLKMEPLELSEKAKELHGQTITVKDNLKVVPKRTDSEAVIRQFQLPTGATAPMSWNQPMPGSGVAKGITVVNALGSNIMGGQNIVVAARGVGPFGARGPIPVNVSLPQSGNMIGARGPVPATINVVGVRGVVPANLNVVGARGQSPVLGRITPPFPGTPGSRITSTVQMASRMPTPSVIMPSSDGSQTRLNFPIRKTQDGKVVFIQDGKDPVGNNQSNPRPIVVHMSGSSTSKVIIQNPSKELQNLQQRQQLQQQHQVAVTVAGGATGSTGHDGKDSYYPPLSNRLQGPTPIRLVNPSSLITSTTTSQPVGMPRGTPPPLMVGTPPIGGSPVTGTGGMGVRLTNPAVRGASPVRPNMGASPIRGGRGMSPVRPMGSPGASPIRGAIPPGGRGGAPARGAPGARMIRPPMRGRGGVRMRGAPGGPLVRGMRPRMPMGRGGPGMRGARPPGVRGAPRGPRPGGPVRPVTPGSATPPVVRPDPSNLPPAPKPKKIKVEVVDLSDEESPPPAPANPALDRLKNCGISISRQKAPTIPKGLKLPPGISLSPAPTGYSSGGRRNSESREGGGGSSYSIRPATEEAPKAPVAAPAPSSTSGSDEVKINVQTLTDEQKNALKAMGLL